MIEGTPIRYLVEGRNVPFTNSQYAASWEEIGIADTMEEAKQLRTAHIDSFWNFRIVEVG